MVRATEGLAEKTKNAPINVKTKIRLRLTLSTVHHQFANRLRFMREILNKPFSFLILYEGNKSQ